jgi:hypothetical protein
MTIMEYCTRQIKNSDKVALTKVATVNLEFDIVGCSGKGYHIPDIGNTSQ